MAQQKYTTAQLVAIIDKQAKANGVNPLILIADSINESGLNPYSNPIDSNGVHSTGLFQLNQKGQGAGYTPEQLMDPNLNASIAAKNFAATAQANPGASAGAIALLSEKPRGYVPGMSADDAAQTQYAKNVQFVFDQLSELGPEKYFGSAWNASPAGASGAGGVNSLPFGNVFGSGQATTSSPTGVDIGPGAWLIAVNDLLNPKGPSLEQTILSLGTENVAEVTEMIFMRAVGAIIGFALIGFGLAAGFGAHPTRTLVGATPVTRRLRQIFSSSGNTDRQAIANSDRRQALINQNAQARHARALDLAKTRAAEQRANTQARSEAKIKEARAREAAKRRTAKYTWDLHAEKANKGSHHP